VLFAHSFVGCQTRPRLLISSFAVADERPQPRPSTLSFEQDPKQHTPQHVPRALGSGARGGVCRAVRSDFQGSRQNGHYLRSKEAWAAPGRRLLLPLLLTRRSLRTAIHAMFSLQPLSRFAVFRFDGSKCGARYGMHRSAWVGVCATVFRLIPSKCAPSRLLYL
jgi:hypothetical protein